MKRNPNSSPNNSNFTELPNYAKIRYIVVTLSPVTFDRIDSFFPLKLNKFYAHTLLASCLSWLIPVGLNE